LLESGRAEEAGRRHADHYLRLAEQAETELGGPAQAEWVDRLEAEVGNLRAAARWASQQGDHELVVRLVSSLWHFWERRRYFREARLWLGASLSADRLDARVRAKALVAQAKLTGRAGDSARAAGLLEESVSLYRGLDDPAGESRARANLGWVLMVRGELERAVAECEQAHALASLADDPAVVADALNNLASALLASGKLEDAEPLFGQCLVLRRELGDEHGVVAALGNLGLLAARRGFLRRAEELLEESLLMARLVEDAWYVANICVSLGYVSWRLEETRRTSELLREGLLTAAELGELPLQADALDGFAALAASFDEAERAAILAGAAAAMRARADVPGEPPPSFRDSFRELLPDRLGPDALRRAAARGRGLAPADAVSLALGDDRVLGR